MGDWHNGKTFYDMCLRPQKATVVKEIALAAIALISRALRFRVFP